MFDLNRGQSAFEQSSEHYELVALRQYNSDLLTEKLNLEQENIRLKREIAELLGASPDERARLRQELDRHQQEIANARDKLQNIDALYRSRERELQKAIEQIIEQKTVYEKDSEEARAILASLRPPIRKLMMDAFDESAKRRSTSTLIASFLLGVVSSLVASWLYTNASLDGLYAAGDWIKGLAARTK